MIKEDALKDLPICLSYKRVLTVNFLCDSQVYYMKFWRNISHVLGIFLQLPYS